MRVYACDCACIGLCSENIASNNINITRKKKSLKMWIEEEKKTEEEENNNYKLTQPVLACYYV